MSRGPHWQFLAWFQTTEGRASTSTDEREANITFAHTHQREHGDWSDPSNADIMLLDQALQLLLSGVSEPQYGWSQSKTDKCGYSIVKHTQQIESWDCGVACLLMVRQWLEDQPTNPESVASVAYLTPERQSGRQSGTDSVAVPKKTQQRYELLKNLATKSIWTADLVVALDRLLKEYHQQFSISKTVARYLFCSKSFEVEDDYRELGYYRAAFSLDQVRVTKIFEQFRKELLGSNTHTRKLVHMPRGIPLDRLVDATSHQHCIAIVLVDNAVLRNPYSDNPPNGEEEQQPSYVGHYVLLCGISKDYADIKRAKDLDSSLQHQNAEKDRDENVHYCLVICNPGHCQPAVSFVTATRFERAWRAKGTDEDVVLVSYLPTSTS